MLRHQLLVYKRSIQKPRIRHYDRVLWILLTTILPAAFWKNALAIVKPATVIKWHRAAHRSFWTWISRRKKPGRPALRSLLRDEIIRMAEENPTWGPERILGELQMAGYRLHINTVRKYMPERTKTLGGNWKNFLDLHSSQIAAMDFFVVPMWNFTPLYVFFIIHHATREILHVNVTAHPNMQWLRQNLKEAFADGSIIPRYLVHDNDPVFVHSRRFMENVLSIAPLRTAPHSPWQNAYAERFVGTIRRELTDHVIPLSEAHLRNLVREYMRHYNEDRTHSSIGRDSPHGRPRAGMPPDRPLIAVPRLRGLHHRYFPLEKAA